MIESGPPSLLFPYSSLSFVTLMLVSSSFLSKPKQESIFLHIFLSRTKENTYFPLNFSLLFFLPLHLFPQVPNVSLCLTCWVFCSQYVFFFCWVKRVGWGDERSDPPWAWPAGNNPPPPPRNGRIWVIAEPTGKEIFFHYHVARHVTRIPPKYKLNLRPPVSTFRSPSLEPETGGRGEGS